MSLDLQAGEMRILTEPSEFSAFEIAGAGAERAYQVVVLSASQVEGSNAPLRFRAVTAASPNVAPSSSATPQATVPGAPAAGNLGEREGRFRRVGHLGRLIDMRREVASLGAARHRGVRTSLAPAAPVPTVGEAVTITSALTPDGGISCNASTPIDGVVKTVGENFVIVEDVAVAGHLTDQDYAELDAELDAFVAPVDQQFFGSPPDLDGNGRVIAFFTGEVNRSGDAIGFFSPLDMFDPVDCPSSNEGEIIWLIGPDPDGDLGDFDITAEEVKELARGLVAHEYQHLIGNFQRFLGGSGPDDIWVDEGLSHLAEEVSGLFRQGLPTRASLGFSEIGLGPDRPVFDDFHEGNLGNVGVYLGSPNEAPALALFDDPETTFAMRGWGYLFLRWLADRYAATGPVSIVGGSAEHLFFREVARGGPMGLAGPDNILRAINEVSGESPAWDDVLSEYFVGPALVGAQASPTGIAFRTWDFARLYDEMAANAVPFLSSGYPLAVTPAALGPGLSRTIDFDIGASTARYFRLSANAAHPDTRIEVTTPSGATVPNGPRARVVVVRTR